MHFHYTSCFYNDQIYRRFQGNWPEQTRIRSAGSAPAGITDKDVTGPEYRPVCLRNCSWRIPGAPEASRL